MLFPFEEHQGAGTTINQINEKRGYLASFLEQMSQVASTGGLVPHIGRDRFHTPVIVVKASHDREGMVDRAVRASLWNGLGREHLEGTGGKLEPENETCQVIEGDLLPVEPLLC